MNKKIIQTVSGHIGAGKSRSFHEWYGDQLRDNDGKPIPVTLATPTNKLSNQHHAYFENECVPSLVISQEHFRSASEEYKRQCAEAYPGVLLANHWVALSTRANTALRLFVSDEFFSPLHTIYIEFEKPEDVRDFAVKDAEVPGYYELIVSDHTIDLIRDVQDKEGRRYKSYGPQSRELGEYIVNTHYRVVIDKESRDAAASGKAFLTNDDEETDEQGKRVFLQFTIFTLPSITDAYLGALLIGANPEKTLLCRMWSKDVDFQPHQDIESRLDYSDLSHKAKYVKIYYPPIPNLSKTFLQRLGKGNHEVGNQTFLHMCANAIGDLFPGRRHIFCTNKHAHKNKEYHWALEGELGGVRVITNPHGWNDLQDINMAVFLAAINFDPVTTQRLYAFYGITAQEAKEALAYELVYQFLGRTSLRDRASTEEVILIVPDKGAAEFIQNMIGNGCAEPTPLPMDFGDQPKRGRPRIEKTAEQKREYERQKKAAQRAKKKATAGMTMQF